MGRNLHIMALALLLLTVSKTATARTYAVCVGLSVYPGGMNNLFVSDKDAELMANLYRRNGNAEVYCLTNSRATVGNVKKTMRAVYAKADTADVVVLFFSGHGSHGAFRCYDGNLLYSSVSECMRQSKAATKLVFADACKSGGMRGAGAETDSDEDNQSCLFFLSSRTAEPSREIWGMSNSVFTHFLANGMKGLADADGNRTVTARELYTYVSENVMRLTRHQQHPVMWGSFSDDMPVIKWPERKG